MGTLSVCCIAKNEAKLLPGMISSLGTLADEILVLNCGSTDKTEEVAVRMGARVHDFEWEDDFSEARNALIDLATGDWLLFLDADERLRPKDLRLLEEMKDSAERMYSVTIQNVLPHRVVESVLPLQSIRMFRRDREVRFAGRVNESIAKAARKAGWEAAKSALRIQHMGFSQGKRMRRIRNRRIFESVLRSEPTEVWLRLHLGLAYYIDEDFTKAEEHLQACVSSSSETMDGVTRSILQSILAEFSFTNKEGSITTRSAALKAMQLTNNLYAEYVLAQLDLRDGHVENAIKHLTNIDTGALNNRHFRVNRGELYADLAKAHLKLQQVDSAMQYAELAMDSPGYDIMFIGGYLCEQKKQYRKALEFYEMAESLTEGSTELKTRIKRCKEFVANS